MPRAKVEVFEQPAVKLAAFAKALAHPARICVLQHLAGKGEVACMDIVAALPLSQPACSRHVNELRKAGLLRSRTQGANVWFRIDESVLQRFCQGMNEVLHPATGLGNGDLPEPEPATT